MHRSVGPCHYLKIKAAWLNQKTYDLAVLDFEDEKLALAETNELSTASFTLVSSAFLGESKPSR